MTESSAGSAASSGGSTTAGATAGSGAAAASTIPGAVWVAGGVGLVGLAAGGGGGGGSSAPSGPTNTAITSNGGGATASVSVAENTTTVTTVTGKADAGETLAYSIVGGADAGKFSINSATGQLSFSAAPNQEAPTDIGTNNVYDVVVQVSDGSTTAQQAIAVTVTGQNEATPVITSNGGGATATVSVAENSKAVTTVAATDADADAVLAYSIAGGADAAKFSINASNGALTFVDAPNFESPTDAGANNVYDVIVQVSDGANVDVQNMAVTVTNVVGTAIVSGAVATVAENATAVTTVSAVSDAGSITYSLVTGGDAALFDINPTTGQLSFKTAPNFEVPTDSGADNVYNVTVRANDGTTSVDQAMTVTVASVSEFAPGITSNGSGTTASVTVTENSTAATTVTASDADAGEILTYSIVGGNDATQFTINASTGALSFLTAPDREAPADNGVNNVYDVVVQVSDGTRTDTQTIAVTVGDANDNAPVITSNGGGATAGVSVAENSTAVTTVTATDADGATTYAYSISGGADAAKFAINASTGVLTFVSAPNFEAPSDAGGNNIYDVTVQVSDGTNTDTQAMAVTVTNLNDIAPVITSNGGGATAGVSVAENSTAVTTVTATDADGTTTYTYSISGGADATKFAIDASTGALAFVSAPNFDVAGDAGANNVYDVVVQVSDGTNVDTQAIAVTVTGVNDNTPAITSNGGASTAGVSVAENATAVTTVTASDADQGTGSSLTYSISGGADSTKFAINGSTGALTFVSAPNYEAQTDADANNVYDVTVQVSDGTNTDTQAIAVTVTGVNDNTPVITSNAGGATASVTINENTTAVTTVTATDADLGTGGSLSYSISGGADATKFAIDASTGALTFVSAPNFEAPTDAGGNNVYDVTVQVSDGTNTDTQAIAVTVADVGALAFTSGTSISVNENTALVGNVAAGSENPVTYSINGGADAAKFTINSTSGALSFVSAPNYEAPTDTGVNNVYDVIVRANDGAATLDQAMAVTVTNLNDIAPVITSNGGGATAGVSVAENSTAVTTVTATDADGTTTYTYSISGGADATKFAIDASTGALAFVSAPNFDVAGDAGADNVYDVVVQVSDGTNVDTQAIAVTVTGVNDNTPAITSNGGGATAGVSVAEKATAVTTVTASDADQGTGSSLTYSISGGADSTKFAINGSTGALTFVSAPNYEAQTDADANNVYDVTVQVSDGTNTDTQAIAVTVTGVNDNSPVFTSPSTASFAENATGTVLTVAATDADLPAQTLSYTLSGVDAGLFNLSSSTGALTFKAAPNYESPLDGGADNVYNLTVTASDNQGLTSTQNVTVNVTPVNEFQPVFQSSASANFAENGTGTVLTAVATDADRPVQTMTYSLSGTDAGLFNLDSGTGALTFKTAPDFEAPSDADDNNVYNVVITASDGVVGSTTSQNVSVTVTDVGALAFTSGTSLSMAENSTAAGTVSAVSETAITYTIVGGADAAKFDVNPTTGALTFKVAPDYEVPSDVGGNNGYEVTVRATDTSTAFVDQTVTVAVTPQNDNQPVFTSGTAYSVSENTTVVGTMAATDADLPAQTLTFSLSGSDSQYFTISASTGALSFTTPPDYEVPQDQDADNIYDVSVTAGDGAGLSQTQLVQVTVNDVLDVAPKVTSVTIPDGLYAAGEAIFVSVVLDQAVNIDTTGGSPFVQLNVGGSIKNATYVTQLNSQTLSFSYVPETGLTDTDGVTMYANGVQLNGATITGSGALPADLSWPATTFVGVQVDSIDPSVTGAQFTGGTSTVSVTFDEVMTAPTGSQPWNMTLNVVTPDNYQNWSLSSLPFTAANSGSNTINFALSGTTLGANDVVRIRFNDFGTQVTDAAGNTLGAEIYIAGGQNQSSPVTLDLDNYSSNLPITIYGNGGADTLAATWGIDKLVDGGGTDTLIGRGGADVIVLAENRESGAPGTTPVFAKDIVHIGLGDSTTLAWDVVRSSSSNPGSGFDVKSATVANHDVLSLPSAQIASNATNVNGTDVGIFAQHSITSGMVTFKTTGGADIVVSKANATDAVQYLATNIKAPGTTVAFQVDTDNNGTVDSTMVFQDNGAATLSMSKDLPDTLVVLGGVTGATLGTSAGNNVIQLVDTTVGNPTDFALTNDGLKLSFTENVFANTGIALTLLKNGITAMTVTSVDGSGTSMLDVSTNQTLAADDWVFLQYAGSNASDAIVDAQGNILPGDDSSSGYGGSAEGSAGNNTINLSAFDDTLEYDITGAAGNDTLIGSGGVNYLDGGTGADVLTGGAGIDYFDFEQGDSPVGVVSLGGDGVFGNNDTFTFSSGVDRITDLSSGEGFNLDVAGADYGVQGSVTFMGASLPTNGQATDQGFFLVQGSFNTGTNVFTVYDTSGTDTLVVYDGDSSASVTQTGIVLSGVTLSELQAYTGSNWISHV